MTAPRVLIGCETSGIFRRAFDARGFDAWSCDLDPAEDGSNRHIIADIRDLLGDGWDLLVVLHPPCTRLCRAGGRWLFGAGRTHPKKLPKGRTWQSMLDEYAAAIDLFEACLHAPIPARAIENPVMHTWAQQDISGLPKPQIVQPHHFGEPVFKATGWYLHGLPTLTPTDPLPVPERGTDEYKAWSAIHRMPPSPDRARLRSRSFPGMAAAAAAQWGDHVLTERRAA